MDNTQEQFDKLAKDIADLTNEIYLNNFSTSQDFNKFSRFNTRLKVPHYNSLPSVCEIGEIIESSGKLYVCSSANTWAIVGSQS